MAGEGPARHLPGWELICGWTVSGGEARMGILRKKFLLEERFLLLGGMKPGLSGGKFQPLRAAHFSTYLPPKNAHHCSLTILFIDVSPATFFLDYFTLDSIIINIIIIHSLLFIIFRKNLPTSFIH